MAENTQTKPMRAPLRRGREPSMDLPEGWTCGGCGHFARCNAMFGHIAQDETCDWSPSRFQPSMAVVNRAVEIADDAMFVQLRSYGWRRGNEVFEEWYRFPPSPDSSCGQEVKEAVEWLLPRGYLEVGSDEHGQFVKVIRQLGDKRG